MDPRSQASRFPRLLAGVMAAVLAVAVVLALVTGEVYSGIRSQNRIARETAPLHYWALVAFSSLGALLLAAVAREPGRTSSGRSGRPGRTRSWASSSSASSAS